MTAPPIKTSGLRVRVWPILRQAIEDGVGWGWQRAHKHDQNPGEDKIKEEIIEHVLSQISESFAIDEDADK